MKNLRLAGFAGLVVLSLAACGGGTSQPEAATSPTPSGTVGSEPLLIDYTNGGRIEGANVPDSGDTSALVDAPAGFAPFISTLAVSQARTARRDCPDLAASVVVARIRTDGFATGGVHACGGYVAIWAEVDGAWQQVIGAQEPPLCSDLRKFEVPAAIGGDKCFDPAGDLVAYVQD